MELVSWLIHVLTMQENPDTTVDASFYGKVIDPSMKCRLHQVPALNYVAFEGINTGRRFYGCGVQVFDIHLGLGLVNVSAL